MVVAVVLFKFGGSVIILGHGQTKTTASKDRQKCTPAGEDTLSPVQRLL